NHRAGLACKRAPLFLSHAALSRHPCQPVRPRGIIRSAGRIHILKGYSIIPGVILMLKKTLAALAMVSFSFQIALAQNRSIKADRAIAAKFSPAVGERLNYDVSWSDFIVAGELTIETKDRRSFDGVDGFHVSAQAQSVGMVSAFV